MLSGMSARERNRAKRKARMAARKSNRDKEDDNDRYDNHMPVTWYVQSHDSHMTCIHVCISVWQHRTIYMYMYMYTQLYMYFYYLQR